MWGKTRLSSLKDGKKHKMSKIFFMCIKLIPIHIFIYLLIRKIYIKRKIVYDQICPGMLALPHKKNFFETIKKRICLKKIQPIWQMYWDLFQPLYYFLSHYPYYLYRQFILKLPSTSSPYYMFSHYFAFSINIYFFCILG